MKNPIGKIREQRDNFQQINRDYLQEKNNLESRTQLKPEVIQNRVKELGNEKGEEINEQKQQLDLLWINEKQKTLIKNDQPEDQEDAVKALHAQNLAGERLPSSGDPGEVVSVVEEELEDRANTEDFARELWQLAARKLQGQDKWNVIKDKMEDLRENYLLSDEDKEKLRFKEALEEVEPRKDNLKSMAGSVYLEIQEGQVTTMEELEELLETYIAPVMEEIEETFQEKLSAN